MKRKANCLVPIDDYGDPILKTPVKLTKKDLSELTVSVHGFDFIDTGYALACPRCGKISGISCREDIDKNIDFFLKFGCEHYTGEALNE